MKLLCNLCWHAADSQECAHGHLTCIQQDGIIYIMCVCMLQVYQEYYLYFEKSEILLYLYNLGNNNR